MSEAERRRWYSERRVLIETTRVLSPQFADSVMCITGAHQEMLRSLMAFLHRRETFVSSYGGAFYLTPTSAEWDAVQAVVADLEDELMGCQEFTDKLDTMIGHLASISFDSQLLALASPRNVVNETVDAVGDGSQPQYLTFMAVPAGYVCQVNAALGTDTTTAWSLLRIEYYDGSVWRHLSHDAPCSAAVTYGVRFPLTLEPGERLRVRFWGATVGDSLRGTLLAYNIEQA